jgi:hypothetical protein
MLTRSSGRTFAATFRVSSNKVRKYYREKPADLKLAGETLKSEAGGLTLCDSFGSTEARKAMAGWN